MSTEHQQYSTQNQADKIQEYADKRGIEIIKTYADEGKSGLSIGGRAALQRLISDVETGLQNLTSFLSMTSVAGGGFKMPMKVPTMSTSAVALASKWPIVQSSLKTTAPQFPQSSKASNAPWLVSTVGSCPQKFSPGNVA